jgi:hypothetical protein
MERDREALLKHYEAAVMDIIAIKKSSATRKLLVIRPGSRSLEILEKATGDNINVLPHHLRSKC